MKRRLALANSVSAGLFVTAATTPVCLFTEACFTLSCHLPDSYSVWLREKRKKKKNRWWEMVPNLNPPLKVNHCILSLSFGWTITSPENHGPIHYSPHHAQHRRFRGLSYQQKDSWTHLDSWPWPCSSGNVSAAIIGLLFSLKLVPCKALATLLL